MFWRAFTNRFNRGGNPRTPRRVAPVLSMLEDRITPATVLLYPGGDCQTDNPYDSSIIYTGYLTVGQDINGQAVDFNKDGAPDLLALTIQFINRIGGEPLAAGTAGLPLLALGNSGRFAQTTVDSGGSSSGAYIENSIGLAVLDWNQDGYQDILSLRNSDNSPVYTLYQNDGSGVFKLILSQRLSQPFASDLENNQICLADFNGDGAPDIIVPTGLQSGEFTIYQGEVAAGKWTGLFNLATANAIQVGTPGELLDSILPIATDLNGDGKLDIAVKGSGIYANLFINDGSGVFSLTPNLRLATVNNQAAFNILSGDLNHDGKKDLVISNNSRSIVVGSNATGPMTVYLNETPASSTGNPVFGTPYGVGGTEVFYGQMALGDMNLDGHVDLVASQQAYNGKLFNVLENDGTGHFLGNPEFVGYNKTNITQSGLALGDWNADGQLDVALVSGWDSIGSPTDSTLSLSVGVSINGTFASPGVIPATLPPAILGQAYSFQLTLTGGDKTLPYVVSVDPTYNSLPPGLSVSPTGLISGTPTRTGPFQVKFWVTQPNGLHGSSLSYLLVNQAVPGALTISPAILPVSYTHLTLPTILRV